MTARTALIATVTLASLSLADAQAWAQDAPPSPRFEVAFDAAVSAADTAGPDLRRTAGSRLRLHLTRDVMLDVSGDLSRTRARDPFTPSDESTSVSAQLRRTTVQRGRVTFDLFVGGGVQSHKTTWPGYDYTVGSYTFSIPAWVDKGTSGLVDFGFGSRQHLARYASLREDFIVRFAETSEYRAAFGLDVPLGGRSIVPRETARFGTTRLGTDDHVWLDLTDGSQVEGRLEHVSSDRLDVITATGRRAITVADIDRIDVPDSVVDGLWRGTAIGAGSGLGLAALAFSIFCEDSSCEPPETALVLLGGSLWGGGLGALIGVLSDGLHVGQRTIYQRTRHASISLAPVLTPRTTGIGATVRW